MLNDKFFQKHQKLLLWVFNTPLGRWFFKISGNKSSVGKNKIIGILPNTIFWKGKGKQVVAEFRTHDKFSKRLYCSFLPLWKLCHAWDTLFANVFRPAWNLGFDSLTQYPDVATGATTCDTPILMLVAVDGTWASVHDATDGTAAGTSTALDTLIEVQELAAGVRYGIYRSGFGFDLSSIAGATISAVTMSYWPTAKNNTAAGNATIYSFTPAVNNSFAVADYDQFGTTAFSTNVLVSGVTTGQYLDFAFNSTGVTNTTPGAINNFGTREVTFDVANSAPPNDTRCNLDGYFADQAGTTNDPKLVVTYTPGGRFLDLTSKSW